MTYATIVVAVDPSSMLDGALGLIKQGPLGLAGLLIALVLTTVLLRTVDHGRERMLKLVLYVGAFCFVIALIAQHFAPIPPVVDTALVAKQHDVLSDVVKALNEAEPDLKQINKLASDGGGCPGGSGGIAIPHGADMASFSSGVLATIKDASASLNSVIKSLPSK